MRALGHSSKNDVLGFDCKLLSTCSDLIEPIITKFANASIHTKCFASYWKLSRVTPIYKGKGDANDKGNYRPISVIGHIAKIIEREITNQVVTYLESNNLLTSDQSAYHAQHSTQTALHTVQDDWLYNISDGLPKTVCSFDIPKCFDIINHSILGENMEKNMVFIKMTLTCSGLTCLIENKLSNVTMKYLICVMSILVFCKDLS